MLVLGFPTLIAGLGFRAVRRLQDSKLSLIVAVLRTTLENHAEAHPAREEWLVLPVWRVLGTRLLTVIHVTISITFPWPQPTLFNIVLEARGHRVCV